MSNPPLAARKDASWYAMCTEPSITKTPVGPVQVPVPYQIISDLSKAMGISPNVMFNGKPAYLLDQSKMMKCVGDEQGTSGGIRSGTTSMEVKPVKGSDSFKVNGKAVVCMEDLCTLNKENCHGKFITAPLLGESLADSKDTLVIKSSKEEACCNDEIDVEAVGMEEQGEYEWTHSRNCYLVDETNHRRKNGKKLKLVIYDDFADPAPLRYATVSVIFQYSGGEVAASKKIQIHEGHRMQDVFDFFKQESGKSADIASGHYTVHTGSSGARTQGPVSDYNFKDEKLALVIIPGMNLYAAGLQPSNLQNDPVLKNRRHTPVDEAEAMYTACNLSFQVKSSALIYNYTRSEPVTRSRPSSENVQSSSGLVKTSMVSVLETDETTLGGTLEADLFKRYAKALGLETVDDDLSIDAVRSLIYYEILGAQDELVNTTVAAIVSGLEAKGEVYVVAHDQGAEIFQIALAKITAAENRQKYWGKIYYQGFGPETYIDKGSSLYLGMARNVKGADDAFPGAWTTVKSIKGIYVFAITRFSVPWAKVESLGWKVLGQLLYTNTSLTKIGMSFLMWEGLKKAKKYIVDDPLDETKTEMRGQAPQYAKPQKTISEKTASKLETVFGKDLVDLGFQKWEVVDTPLPIHYQGVWRGEHYYYLCEKNKRDHVHGFMKMYWPYLKVPVNGTRPPTQYAMSVNNKPNLTPELSKKLLEAEKNPSHPGAQIVKQGVVNGGNPADVSQQVTLAYFVNGMAGFLNQSNLDVMRQALYEARRNLPTTISVWAEQDPGPGKEFPSPAEEELGDDSMSIAKEIYAYLCREYDAYYSEGYRDITIDLYGFSRGAAIVNEVAWMIDTDNIQLTDMETVVPKGTVKVRFLGLFDTVHVMGMDGPNHTQQWHNKNIAGCVQYAAHALAYDETRKYYAPTIFHPLAGQSTRIVQVGFPGIHTDIGGGQGNNSQISKLTMSWMAKQATNAGIPYLQALILSPTEEERLKHDPNLLKPGQEGYPDDAYVQKGHWFFWEKEHWRDIVDMKPEERMDYLEPKSAVKEIRDSDGRVIGKTERKKRELRGVRTLVGVNDYLNIQ